MAEKPKMRWSRTDVSEDFDPKVLLLARLRPLAGKGLYSILLNLIYQRAPGPFHLDDAAWDQLETALPRSTRRTILDLVDACVRCELFDREAYERDGELTSRRIRQEIKARFGDMARAQRQRDSRRDSAVTLP